MIDGRSTEQPPPPSSTSTPPPSALEAIQHQPTEAKGNDDKHPLSTTSNSSSIAGTVNECKQQTSRSKKKRTLEDSCEEQTVVSTVKKFKLVQRDSKAFIYCELEQTVRDDSADNDNDNDNEADSEKLEFAVRPMIGTPFTVSVPKHGCLFDLYDAIFVHTQIPWERQILTVLGERLPNEESLMLSNPLPANNREVGLSVKMCSGMEQTVVYDDVIGETIEFVVNLEDVEGLEQLSLLDATSSGLESQIEEEKPAVVSGPPVPGPEPPKPDSKPDFKGNCHFCKIKCRPALQFTCKCGNTFCHLHRYHDQHRCPVDIAAIDKEGLARANPRVVRDRL